MKKYLVVLISVIASLMVALPVLAAAYYATYTITESNGTDYDMLPVTEDSPNVWLADNNFMEADALDTRIETSGGLLKPHMVARDRTLTAVPVPADSQVNLLFTTGNTDLTDLNIITGDGGYITIPDAAALELGNNFEIELTDTYVNTDYAASKDLVFKDDAFYLYISAEDTLTCEFTDGVGTNTNLAPDGAGTVTGIGQVVGAATHWQANLTNDGDTSYVRELGGAMTYDLYTMDDTTATGVISSVVVHVVCSIAGGNAKTYLRTHATNYAGANNALGAAYVDYSTTYNTNPNTAAAWTWDEIDDLEAGVGLDNAGRCTQTYVVVNYYPSYVAEVAPMASDEYDVSASSDGTWLMLSLDGDTSWDGTNSDRVATGGGSLIDNANDWVILESEATPYAGAFTHTVSGTLIVNYNPNDVVGGETYAVGTVTVTNGDATVVGAGTTWTQEMVDGLFLSTDAVYYVIDSVTDTTHLELTTVYGGGTLAGQAYNMYPRMPDREGAAQHGIITWGSNPAGVTVKFLVLSLFLVMFVAV